MEISSGLTRRLHVILVMTYGELVSIIPREISEEIAHHHAVIFVIIC